MPSVKNLLEKKGCQVWAVPPDVSVLDATNEMNRHHVGALLVVEDDQVVGIFTERDILTRVISSGKPPADIKVGDVMTSQVAYCTPETPVQVCKSIFTEKRIRHMPVMEGGRPIGVVTSGDILAYEANDLQLTVRYLEAYIYES